MKSNWSVMDYCSAREWISNLTIEKGMVFGLENMELLLEKLGGFDVPTVHIAGTNGKGSLCAFTESILKSAGYRVGVYTSPAVGTPLEIIRVDGKNIPEEAYAAYLTKIRECADSFKISPTAFEIETIAALKYFTDAQCDICIVECGLGGRLDATNVITSTVVAAFASIGLDHMHILGDSVEKIALEKSGIIKPNICVVMQDSGDSVYEVIERVCKEKDATLNITTKPENIHTGHYSTFDYGMYKELMIVEPGLYQVTNACEAVEVAHTLKLCGFGKIDEKAIRTGLGSMSLSYRYETVCDVPLVIIDGAHNEDAVKKLMKNIETDGYKDVTFVMGMFKDKDYNSAVKLSLRYAKKYITITPPGPRGLKSSILAETIREKDRHIPIVDCDTVNEAVRYILQNTKKDDIIVAFGSLSYLESFRDSIERQRT